MRSSLSDSFMYLSDFIKTINSTIELIALDITVAMATPFTVILRTITKNKFKSTLRQPESASTISGVFVSPTLLKTADRKLYNSITGKPSRYMRRYRTAYGSTSSGMLITDKICTAKISPGIITRKPPIIAVSTEV